METLLTGDWGAAEDLRKFTHKHSPAFARTTEIKYTRKLNDILQINMWIYFIDQLTLNFIIKMYLWGLKMVFHGLFLSNFTVLHQACASEVNPNSFSCSCPPANINDCHEMDFVFSKQE